tara:strand:+ start:27698 stop:28426 length:729 start_codon:yes stop_codon:yes gene_type:complete
MHFGCSADPVAAADASLDRLDSAPRPDSRPSPDAQLDDPCDAVVDLFPTPINDESSLFDDEDDGALEVQFKAPFTFSFYDTTYSSVFLNSNGGMTFGAGDTQYEPPASLVTNPGIAVFWGDMRAALAVQREDQMTYQACNDRFIVNYTRLQDVTNIDFDNSAEVTLFPNGSVTIAYGSVLSTGLLVGIFDGTHSDDRTVLIDDSFPDYPALGTGVLMFDSFRDGGGQHGGRLSEKVIEFKVP